MFTADFETNNYEQDCRVWAWGLCNIDTQEFTWGKDIDSFIKFILSRGSETYYFHNLKFDGNFIISFLLNHGWKHTFNKTLAKKEFKTLISDKGQFYSITLCWTNAKGKRFLIKILDSYKLIPLPIEKIGKDFDLEEQKGEIDYNLYREKDYNPTAEEIEYLRKDVVIAAKALNLFFKQGLTAMTIGGNALKFYKDQSGIKNFKRRFPVSSYEIDKDQRQSYKGAWTYLNPKWAGKTISKPGIILDVNSLYPYVMAEKLLPYGEGIFYKGKYKKDNIYELYIQMVKCQFELKPGFLPTIQLKHNFMFKPTEYLTTSGSEEITMVLTCVDLEIFLMHYNVYNIEYISGWKFKASDKMFKDYVQYWGDVKINADKEKNKAMRTIAKLYLNNLYGKFGKNPKIANKEPYLDSEGVVRFRLCDYEIVNSIYIPVASFITAYAREKTITSAQAVYDRFIYADTDSLHLIGTEIPKGLEIDAYKLGAWKLENTFTKARFIRSKSYIEVIDGENHITCAGLTKGRIGEIKFKDFKAGYIFPYNLKAKSVKGGIILKDSTFEIKL